MFILLHQEVEGQVDQAYVAWLQAIRPRCMRGGDVSTNSPRGCGPRRSCGKVPSYRMDGPGVCGVDKFLPVHPEFVGQIAQVARTLVTSWTAQVYEGWRCFY